MYPITPDMHGFSTGRVNCCTSYLLQDNVVVDVRQVKYSRSNQAGTADGFTNASVLLKDYGIVTTTGEQLGYRASNRSTADDGHVITHQV